MDDLASAVGLLITIFVLVVFAVLIVLMLLCRQFSTKYIKDKSAFLRNVVSVVFFYLLSSAYFFLQFGPYWGQVFAFKILPVISLLILLFLELFELFKNLILRANR